MGAPSKSLPPRGEGGWPPGQTDEEAMIGVLRSWQGSFAAAFSSLPPRGEGGWPPGQTDEGTIIERFRFSQGGFAACGRRVTFPAMGKSPKDRRGTAQDEHFVLIFAFPIPSGLRPSSLPLLAFGHFPRTGGIGPLTRGVGPRSPILRGPPIRRPWQSAQRRGWLS